MSYSLGGILLGPFFKSKDSFRQKGLTNDMIRFTWVRSKFPGVNEVIQLIPEKIIYQVDDHRCKTSPYEGIHLTLNHIYELQIHTPESLAVREHSVHHRIYKLKRYNDSIFEEYNDEMLKRQADIQREIYMSSELPMNIAISTKNNVHFMVEDLFDKLNIDVENIEVLS